MADSPEILWTPSEQAIAESNLTGYLDWLRQRKNLDFPDYQALWGWSTTEIEAFWESIWEYFGIVSEKGLASASPYETVLRDRSMPGAAWFPGAQLNYTENMFERKPRAGTAIYYRTESGEQAEISWGELKQQTAKLAAAFRALGKAAREGGF